MSRPRRIEGFSYTGPYRYFVTTCSRSREKTFLDDRIAEATIAQFLRTAADEAFAVLAYCLMPDHMHLLVEGSTDDANLRRFMKMAKQRSGAIYALQYGRPLWQEGYYDRALRADEDVADVARYILENPLRARLVESPELYRWSGLTPGSKGRGPTAGPKGPALL